MTQQNAIEQTSTDYFMGRFARYMASTIGLCAIVVGIGFITAYLFFHTANEPMAKFGIFIFGFGIAMILAIVAGEKYSVLITNLSFGGTLAALYIFLFIAEDFLFPPDPVVHRQEIRHLQMTIKCPINESGSEDVDLILALDSPVGHQTMIDDYVHLFGEDEAKRMYISSGLHNYPSLRPYHIILPRLQGRSFFVPSIHAMDRYDLIAYVLPHESSGTTTNEVDAADTDLPNPIFSVSVRPARFDVPAEEDDEREVSIIDAQIDFRGIKDFLCVRDGLR